MQGASIPRDRLLDSAAMTVTLLLFSILDKIKNLQKLNYTQNSISKIFVPLMEIINILNLKGHYIRNQAI